MFAVKPQTSSWTSAHAQGYFSVIILVLVEFDGFTLSLVLRGPSVVGATLVLQASILKEPPVSLPRGSRFCASYVSPRYPSYGLTDAAPHEGRH
jgi:hypothetical protein